jgi:hypothetical protein
MGARPGVAGAAGSLPAGAGAGPGGDAGGFNAEGNWVGLAISWLIGESLLASLLGTYPHLKRGTSSSNRTSLTWP